MKKFIIFVFMLIFLQNSINAQFIIDNNILRTFGTSMFQNDGRNKEMIEGSPYLNVKFLNAQISGAPEKTKMRYNSFTDLFEIQGQDDKIFNLNKTEPYTSIIFETSFTKYRLVSYRDDNGDNYGYFNEILGAGKITLLKKEKSILIKAKEAKNSYEEAKLARYEKLSDEFYWNLNSEFFVRIPTSKKKLIELFPLKKDEINDFFSNYSPNFKDEKSLIAIVGLCEKFL